MRYLLWRRMLDAPITFSERIARVEPERRYVVDDVAKVVGADSHHVWGPNDFGPANVPGKIAWFEWSYDPRFLQEALGDLGYDKATSESERFGAFCVSYRIPTTRTARVAKQFEESVSEDERSRLIEACPGGILNVAASYVCHERDRNSIWAEMPLGGMAVVRLGEYSWAVRPDGSLLPPEHGCEYFYSVSSGRSVRSVLEFVTKTRGAEARESAYYLFDKNATTIMLACGLFGNEGATPLLTEFTGVDPYDDSGSGPVSMSDVRLTPERVIGRDACQVIADDVSRDRRCIDLESIADRLGCSYGIVSSAAAKAGLRRISPEDCEAILREREEKERQREEEERLERIASSRRARWAAHKAKRDAAQAERLRQAESLRRIQGDVRLRGVEERDDDESIVSRRPARYKPERDSSASLRPVIPSPLPREPEDATRPGPDYPWGDDAFYQGRHWRVVFATSASGRSHARDYLDWLRDVAPGDYDSIRETVKIVADDPLGHMVVLKRFKCFSRPAGYLVCEFKKSGLAGHARVLAFRDTRPGVGGKVERRIVLVHGFSKQSNETPDEELERADAIRAGWLSRR